MPTHGVTSSNATAPIDRLNLNLDNLRTGASSEATPNWSGGGTLCACNCFDAGDE